MRTSSLAPTRPACCQELEVCISFLGNTVSRRFRTAAIMCDLAANSVGPSGVGVSFTRGTFPRQLASVPVGSFFRYVFHFLKFFPLFQHGINFSMENVTFIHGRSGASLSTLSDSGSGPVFHWLDFRDSGPLRCFGSCTSLWCFTGYFKDSGGSLLTLSGIVPVFTGYSLRTQGLGTPPNLPEPY